MLRRGPARSTARHILLAVAVAAGCGGPPTNPPSPAPPPVLAGQICGVERWPVKTLSDADATSVDVTTVQPTTIKTLNELAVHCSGIPSPRTYPEEFRLYEVTGRITVAKSENDHDYHVALADLDEPAYTIVTEIADPLCDGAVQSPFRLLLSSARSTFDAITGGHAISSLVGAILKVRGIGFYDFNHGQSGRSQSCLELHPVLSVERIQ